MEIPDIEKLQKKTRKDLVARITLGGSFPRGNIYSDPKKLTDKQKREFREKVISELDSLLMKIQQRKIYTNEDHYSSIQRFTKLISKQYSQILNKGILRIGVAQKLVNLYWKFSWLLLENIKEPIHCPFDSIIISKLDKSVRGLKWTQISDISEYQQLIASAHVISQEYGSIANWELKVYLEYNNYLKATKSLY